MEHQRSYQTTVQGLHVQKHQPDRHTNISGHWPDTSGTSKQGREVRLQDLRSARLCTAGKQHLLAARVALALPISKVAGRGMPMVTLYVCNY